MHLLRYAFDEAAASLWRGRRSGLLSTATIAIALFVLGAFLVVTSNLERLAEEWSGAAELSVYLADDIGGAERAALEPVQPLFVVANVGDARRRAHAVHQGVHGDLGCRGGPQSDIQGSR